ncbi:hypothetical protein [Streptomyces sp. NPDC006012]|uniref:hypothetical protein n=1 Tax=Streptomyces sp. NPDC006012 TaxID=3364739 RepID=UPI00369C402F
MSDTTSRPVLLGRAPFTHTNKEKKWNIPMKKRRSTWSSTRSSVDSGKGGQGEFAEENGLVPSTFNYGVTNSNKRGAGLKVRSRYKRISSDEIRRILEAWMADLEERTLAEFGRDHCDPVTGQPDPITERTVQRWAKNASKYGLSQQAVDDCRERRARGHSVKLYTDDEKKEYLDKFFGQSGSLEEFARAERVPRDTLKYWLKKRAAQERGAQDSLDILRQGILAPGPAQFPAASGHTDASQAGPSQVAEWVIPPPPVDWGWDQYVDYGALQGHSQQDGVAGFGLGSSGVAAYAAGFPQKFLPDSSSAVGFPQEFLPDSSSAPALDSDAYNQYLLSLTGDPGVASHYLSTGSGQSPDHSSRWGNWSTNPSGQGAGRPFGRS